MYSKTKHPWFALKKPTGCYCSIFHNVFTHKVSAVVSKVGLNENDLLYTVRRSESLKNTAVLSGRRPKAERWLSGDHLTQVKLLG